MFKTYRFNPDLSHWPMTWHIRLNFNPHGTLDERWNLILQGRHFPNKYWSGANLIKVHLAKNQSSSSNVGLRAHTKSNCKTSRKLNKKRRINLDNLKKRNKNWTLTHAFAFFFAIGSFNTIVLSFLNFKMWFSCTSNWGTKNLFCTLPTRRTFLRSFMECWTR